MDVDPSTDPSLTAWERSLHRLAAWMTRGNRMIEPSRPLVPTREWEPVRRTSEPSKRTTPPATLTKADAGTGRISPCVS